MDQCQVVRCRQPAEIIYYGKDVCQKHWEMHCENKRRFDLRDVFRIKKVTVQRRSAMKKKGLKTLLKIGAVMAVLLMVCPMVLCGEAAPEIAIPSASEFMVAFKAGDWLTLAVYVFGTVFVLLSGAKRLDEWRRTQLTTANAITDEKERSRELLKVRLSEVAQGAVAEVYEEYYRGIKLATKNGELAAEEQAAAKKTARDMAVNKIVGLAKSEGLDVAKEFGLPYLKAAVEAAVGALKRRNAKPPAA